MLVGIFIFLNLNSIDNANMINKIQEANLMGLDQPSLKRYVEDCIEEVATMPIYHIGENGGVINISRTRFIWYDEEQYQILGEVVEGYKGYSSEVMTRQMMEKEFEDYLPKKIMECVRLDPFIKKGYNIRKGNITVSAKIGYEDIIFEVHFPLQLDKNDNQLILSDFSRRIEFPLGELYELGVDIINHEIADGDFDKDSFMAETGEYITIEKYRPYPNKVYKLIKYLPKRDMYYIFKFLLKGEETVSRIGTEKPAKYLYGCCKNPYDGMCFKNADSLDCALYGLTVIDNPSCICEKRFENPGDASCDGYECRDCERIYEYKTGKYTGPSKKHGESWCSYDSVVLSLSGVGGMSYVGSRSRKHSCIDGKEIVEECRDYREEICTEQTVGGVSKAACRVNRWDDCFLCEDESCCTDSTMRDCSWSDWLDTNNKCHPLVPPGFRFWLGEGAEVCNIATDFERCGGFMCSNKWVDDTALSCYFQGDCGNYRNIEDVKTKGAHLNTDPKWWPRNYVYHQDGLNINPIEHNKKALHIGLDTKDQYMGPIKYPTNAAKMPILISAGLSYIDELASLSIIDFMNPLNPPDIEVLDYSFCSVWLPPSGGDDCDKCEAPFKSCTEYRCRSLGETCRYIEDKGRGKCIVDDSDDGKDPLILYDIISLGKEYNASFTEMKLKDMTIQGVKISPDIKQHKKFTFGIVTSEPTRCKISYIPKINFEYLPSVWFGDALFSTTHNLTMRMPPALVLPKRIYELLNISDLEELLASLEDITGSYEKYKQKYAVPIKMYKMVTGEDILGMIDPFIKIVLYYFQEYSSLYKNGKIFLKYLFIGFESNTYYMFVKCVDKQGNENSDDFFIEFTIDSQLNDTYPPEILGIEPKNNTIMNGNLSSFSFSVYTDEWAECRYSYFDTNFEKMLGVMQCPDSQYRLNAAFDGSYECTANLNATPLLYIRCKDNPIRKKSFYIGLNSSNVFNVSKEQSRYLNLTESNKIIASARYIDGTKINVATSTVDLDLYIDNPYLCKYAKEDIPFSEMQNILKCSPSESDNIDIGVYVCKETVNIESDMYITCIDTNETVRNVNNEGYEVIYELE
jgi:hypothetical protein